jgi:DNA-binding MarR family transcriptional regulator
MSSYNVVGSVKLSRLDKAIVAVAHAHRRRAAELLAPLGLHPGQDVLLSVLSKRASATQAQLARILRVEPPTLAVMVRRLEASGFVHRSRTPEDARVKIVSLTTAGQIAARAAEIAMAQLFQITRTSLGDNEADIDTLTQLLERVAAGLQDP